jgi:hypothetical protein
MRTVVPAGANVTPSLALGWALAFWLDEPEDAGWEFAVDLADDDVEDVAGAELDDDDAAVLWAALLEAAPVVEVGVELDDPPHAVSSSTSEPSPAVTVHPLLRITSVSLEEDPKPGPFGVPEVLSGTQPAYVMSFAESLTTCHMPSIPLPFVLIMIAPLSVYRG